MKVYLVAGIHPHIPAASGIRSYVLGLADALAKRGIEIVVVGAGPTASVSFGRFEPATGTYPLSNYAFVHALAAWLRRRRVEPDAFVHAQRPDDLYPFVRKDPGGRLILTLHGDPHRGVSERRPVGRHLYSFAERRALASARWVVSVSHVGLEAYIGRYPGLRQKTSVIPVGLDLSKFRPCDRMEARRSLGLEQRMALLFAGRLEVEKNVQLLLDAAKGLEASFDVLVAGQGRLEGWLRERSAESAVRFLGPVPHDEMPVLLSAVDALVLPSSYEGLPTVALESIACGTPVIATRVGDLPRVLEDGRTGLFFSGGAEDLRDVLQQRVDELPRMRPNCASAAKSFGWPGIAERIEEVYRAAA